MVCSAVGKRRRNAGVKIIMRVAEQGEDGGHKLSRCRRAARGRRLQRSGNDPSVSAAFHCDVGLVEGQGEHPVAMPESESGTKRNRCMTTEWHFRFWREIAYSPASAGRNGKNSLREPDLRRDSLHLRVVGKLIGNQDTCGISSDIPIGERSNSQDIHSRRRRVLAADCDVIANMNGSSATTRSHRNCESWPCLGKGLEQSLHDRHVPLASYRIRMRSKTSGLCFYHFEFDLSDTYLSSHPGVLFPGCRAVNRDIRPEADLAQIWNSSGGRNGVEARTAV